MGAASAKAGAPAMGTAPAKPAAAPKTAGAKGPAGTTSPKGRKTPKEGAGSPKGDAPAKEGASGAPGPGGGLSPQEKSRLAAVEGRAGANKAAVTTHQSAEAAADDAHSAAKEPQNEADGKALGTQVENLEENPPPDPEIEKKIAKIKDEITKRRPVTEEELPKAKPKEMAAAAGASVEGDVKGAAEGVQTGYDGIGDKPAGTPDKPVTPIPPDAAAPGAPAIDAAKATPDPANPSQAGVEADKKAVAEKAKDAKLDRPEVADIKEGPVADAASAQKDVNNLAIWGPDEIVKSDKELRAAATADFKTSEADALKQMKAARAKKLGDVKGAKEDAKGGEETKRDALGKKLADIYQDAEDQVRAKLKPLVPTALKMWDDGIAPLGTNFENALSRVDVYIKEHKESFLNRLGDAILGLPQWIVDEYEKAQEAFVEGASALARTVSSWVNGVIRNCQKVISSARAAIQKEIDGLDPSLREYALEEQRKIARQFDALAAEAEGARKDFSNQLGHKLVAAVKEKNEKIEKLREMSKGLLQHFEDAVNEFIDDPLRAIVNGLLRLVGIPPEQFWALVDKFGKVVDDIADRPMVFANNLVAAIKLGFQQFKDNILSHLIKGLLDWLTSKLKEAGVQAPKDFSLKSMLTLFLQILGISWPKIRVKLVKYIGEKNMKRIELAVEFLTAFIKDGWDGVWALLKEKLDPQQLVDAVLSAVKTYLIETIVKKAAEYIISLFNPAGLVYQALKLIYQAVSWIVDNAAKIFTLIQSIVDGAANIMAGAIGGAASMVEKALGAIVPIVIDLFAKLLSLGGLPDKVKEVVGSLQETVSQALDKVIEWVASKIGLSKEKDKQEGDVGERVEFEGGGESHAIWIKVEGTTATVMVASSPTPLLQWLDQLEKKTDTLPEEKKKEAPALLGAARKLAQATDKHSDDAAAARKAEGASTSAPAGDGDAKNKQVIEDEKSLSETVKKVADLFGEKAPEGHPQVGAYNALPSVPDYNKHHVPPKALANWIARQLATIPNELAKLEVAVQMRQTRLRAAAEHGSGGPNLASIVLHKNTHIRTTGDPGNDDYRAHHGKKTQELVEEALKKRGIVPIKKAGRLLEKEDLERQAEELAEGADTTAPGKASTQFYLTELDAAKEEVALVEENDLNEFVKSVADVFYRAWIQSFEAVKVGLDHSGSRDGTESSKAAAVGNLQSIAPGTWSNLDSDGKVTRF